MKISYMIKRLLPYIKRHRKILILDIFCAVFLAVSNNVPPLAVRQISNQADAVTVELLIQVMGIYLAFTVFTSIANFYMNYMGNVFSVRVETDMRRDLFKHLQELSYSFYSENPIGQIMSRLTNDLSDSSTFIHTMPQQLLIAGGTLVMSFCILLRISIPLTLMVFATLPVIFVGTRYFNKRMRITMKEQRVELGRINSQVEDTLAGIRVVKSFANEDAEIDKFGVRNKNYMEIKTKTYFHLAGFQCFTGTLGGVIYLAVAVLGGVFLMNHKIQAGDYAAYILYISTLWTSIRTLVGFTENFQRGMTGIERFLELLDTEPEMVDCPDARILEKCDGEIEFKDVSFRYKGADRDVLHDISLKINKGESVAFVGASGGGKTTLVNLIPRFYDVTAGQVLIDGSDIRKWELNSVRQAIGIVQQDVYLFSGTVYENILYGRLNATRDEVIAAAKQAGAHEFIQNLENGYDTYVGEHGVKLSGGQKQRISIARVFLKNPPILILDEATSALDNESERLVQESLEELSKGRTVITIAHRLTTVQGVDRIMVLTREGIEETGTHRELMAKKGIYFNMYTVAGMQK